MTTPLPETLPTSPGSSRVRRRKGRAAAIGVVSWCSLFWLSALLVGAANAEEQAGMSAPAAGPGVALEEPRSSEVESLRIRFGLALLGLTAVAAGLWTRRSSSPSRGSERTERARLAALALVALLSYASYYDFFRSEHDIGFKETDVYHYYMGSKYFEEVGYFELYNCTIAALTRSGAISRFDLPPVRDQRTLGWQTPDQTLARSHRCSERFSTERWQEFRSDIAWFSSRLASGHWKLMMRDHGYNPTPVWSLIGGSLTSSVSLGSGSFELLILTDRLLVIVAMAFIAWAFGLEAALLAVVVWGTGHHWSYGWIGDSLLRNLWLFCVLVGLSLLRKQKLLASGALLCLAALLRIFPAIFLLAFVLHAGLELRRTGSLSRKAARFFVGAGVAGALLLGLSAWFGPGGAAAYPALAEKMSAFSDRPGLNKVGLSTACWRLVMSLAGQMSSNEMGRPVAFGPPTAMLSAVMMGLQLLVVIPALVLFSRILTRLAAWQATAAAAVLIPILSSPANYYLGYFLALAMLGREWPRIAVALAAAAAAWLANGLLFYRLHEEYMGASAIAVALSLFVLFEMGWRTRGGERGPEAGESRRDSVAAGSAPAGSGLAAGSGGQE